MSYFQIIMWNKKEFIFLWVLLVSPQQAEDSMTEKCFLNLKDCADSLEESKMIVEELRVMMQNQVYTAFCF